MPEFTPEIGSESQSYILQSYFPFELSSLLLIQLWWGGKVVTESVSVADSTLSYVNCKQKAIKSNRILGIVSMCMGANKHTGTGIKSKSMSLPLPLYYYCNVTFDERHQKMWTWKRHHPFGVTRIVCAIFLHRNECSYQGDGYCDILINQTKGVCLLIRCYSWVINNLNWDERNQIN